MQLFHLYNSSSSWYKKALIETNPLVLLLAYTEAIRTFGNRRKGPLTPPPLPPLFLLRPL